MRGGGQRVAPGHKHLVQGLKAGGLRFGDQKVAAQEPDRVFNVAFRMSRIRVAVAGLGPVMQLERGEQLGFHDLCPYLAADARGVVKDQVPGCGTDMFKYLPKPVADARAKWLFAVDGETGSVS